MSGIEYGPKIARLFDLIRVKGSKDFLQEAVAPFAFFLLMRWAEEQQAEEETIALFEGRDYYPQISDEFSWTQITNIYQRSYETENFHHFFRYLVGNLQSLRGDGTAQILKQAAEVIDVERLRPNSQMLIEICRIIDEFSFTTPEDREKVADFFESLVETSIRHTKFGGEFYSPQNITDLVLEIADPKPGERVYDPCFGAGGFLAHAGRRMLAQADSPVEWEKVRTNGIYGIELYSTAFLIGLTRTVLAGITQPNLVLGNALERNGYEAQPKFDVILAAPPLGGIVDRSRSLLNFYQFPARNVENLFIQHIAAHLAPNGRAIVAMPEGFLFRSGADMHLREYLLKHFEVEGVISLPVGSFAPYTMVKPNLVIFRRNEPKDYVWFQQVGAKKRGKSVGFIPFSEAHLFKHKSPIPKIVSQSFEIPSSSYLWKVSVNDLAEKEYDLSVKPIKSEQLDSYIQKIVEKIPQTEVVKLKSIAEVISGVGYTRNTTSEEPIETNVPLIRVTELSKTGEIKRPVRFVNEELLLRSSKKRLRKGDIILSTQGTIGKTGRVTENEDGAIPAHGITVIRLTGKKVHFVNYLLNILQSSEYQNWLNSEATGSVIMNLSIKRLGELPIPVLSEEFQSEISSEYWANQETIDILDFINKPTDAGGLLLTDKFVKDLIENGFDKEYLREETFRLGQLLEELESKLESETDDLFYGLSELKKISNKLSSSFFMPANASRFAFLQIIISDIKKYQENDFFIRTLNKDNAPKPIPRKFYLLKQLSDALEKVVENECHNLLYENGHFHLKIEPSLVEVGKEVQFTVSLFNPTILPLRDVWFQLNNKGFLMSKIILESGDTANFQLQSFIETEGEHTFEISWRGLQFDDETAGGIIEHHFQATRQQSLFDDSDLGTNPYIVGSPLQADKSQQMFFGRQDIINKIRRILRTEGESTVLLMEGNRRAGKTSILNRLQLPEILPNWIPVYFSMQEAEGSASGNGIATEEIFYTLTKKIILSLHKFGYEFEAISVGKISGQISSLKLRSLLREKMRPEFESGNSFELLDSQIEALRTVIGEKRILLMLDEFDKVHQGIKSGVTSSIVPENIRALLHKHNHISAILTGAKRIKHLREDYFSALYGLGIPIPVDALDAGSARKLITEPVAHRLLFRTEAREKILELTKCQPYLIQSLCSRIFDECAERREKIVTQKTVETATGKMTADNEHFKTLFDFIPNLRSRYIACLVNDLQKNSDRVTFNLISEKLLEKGVQHKPKELDEDIKSLRELDVLELENNSYRIKLPLFGEWLSKNEDINAVQRQAAEE